MPRIPQRYRLLQHALEAGSVTRLTAMRDVGVTELASRIGELEAEGVRFQREPARGMNRYGDRVTYTRYWPVHVPRAVLQHVPTRLPDGQHQPRMAVGQ